MLFFQIVKKSLIQYFKASVNVIQEVKPNFQINICWILFISTRFDINSAHMHCCLTSKNQYYLPTQTYETMTPIVPLQEKKKVYLNLFNHTSFSLQAKNNPLE